MKRAALIILIAYASSIAIAHADTTPYIPTGPWAGYITTTTGNYTRITGNWNVPTATCTTQRAEAAEWIGLGGSGNTTFYGPIQDGTDSDCISGHPHYYAWWETYPDPYINTRQTIRPGDQIASTITVTPTNTTFQLADLTTGQTYTHTTHVAFTPAATQTAEWVIEGPYTTIGNWALTTLTPTTITNATITDNTGHTGTITDPAWTMTPEQIIKPYSTTAPSPLDPTGTTFTITN